MSKGVRDVLLGLCSLAMCGLLWWETSKPQYQADKVQDYGFDPAFFPRILLGVWVVLSVLVLVRALKVWNERVDGQRWARLAGSIAITVGYVSLMSLIGFALASMVFAIAIQLFLGLRGPVLVPAIAVTFPLATWYSFVYLLAIPLPTSPWFTRF